MYVWVVQQIVGPLSSLDSEMSLTWESFGTTNLVVLSISAVVMVVFLCRNTLMSRLCLYLDNHMEEHLRQKNNLKRPKRIILIRHGRSAGNDDKYLYQHVPDCQIELTPEGMVQSEMAGKALKKLIGDETVMFYVSPFLRSQQTFALISRAFSPQQILQVREDPRIREQEWGNFQDIDNLETILAQRRIVGRFFYRFNGGESGADVYDRVSSFLSSFFREMKNDRPCENIVIVSHGLLIRLFLMRYYRWSVEKFHSVWNFENCEFAIMEKQANYTYALTTPIRSSFPPSSKFGSLTPVRVCNSPRKRNVKAQGKTDGKDGLPVLDLTVTKKNNPSPKLAFVEPDGSRTPTLNARKSFGQQMQNGGLGVGHDFDFGGFFGGAQGNGYSSSEGGSNHSGHHHKHNGSIHGKVDSNSIHKVDGSIHAAVAVAAEAAEEVKRDMNVARASMLLSPTVSMMKMKAADTEVELVNKPTSHHDISEN